MKLLELILKDVKSLNIDINIGSENKFGILEGFANACLRGRIDVVKLLLDQANKFKRRPSFGKGSIQ